MKKPKYQKYDYKQRQQIQKKVCITHEDRFLADLLKMCNNNLNAFIETDTWYDNTDVNLVWSEPETDEQMTKRITEYEAMLKHKKNKKAEQKKAQLEFEHKEYIRLKKKFEK
jgi:uncharacterized protein YbaP (TraB family)